jgi:hypothetical protein
MLLRSGRAAARAAPKMEAPDAAGAATPSRPRASAESGMLTPEGSPISEGGLLAKRGASGDESDPGPKKARADAPPVCVAVKEVCDPQVMAPGRGTLSARVLAHQREDTPDLERLLTESPFCLSIECCRGATTAPLTAFLSNSEWLASFFEDSQQSYVALPDPLFDANMLFSLAIDSTHSVELRRKLAFIVETLHEDRYRALPRVLEWCAFFVAAEKTLGVLSRLHGAAAALGADNDMARGLAGGGASSNTRLNFLHWVGRIEDRLGHDAMV